MIYRFNIPNIFDHYNAFSIYSKKMLLLIHFDKIILKMKEIVSYKIHCYTNRKNKHHRRSYQNLRRINSVFLFKQSI